MKCAAQECSKRLSIVERELTCRCGQRFCAQHRCYTQHACVKLDFQLPPIRPQRILSHRQRDFHAAF